MDSGTAGRAGRPAGSGHYITRRGQQWYFNYNIPKDVRHLFNGESHSRCSLKTTDRSTALQKARPLVIDIEAQIEASRSSNRPEAVLYRQLSETTDAAEIARSSTPWDDEGDDRARRVIEEKIAEHGPNLKTALKRRDSIRGMINTLTRRIADDTFWLLEPYWTLARSEEFSADVLITLKSEFDQTIQLLKNKYTAANSFTFDWAYGIWAGQKTRPKQTRTEVHKHLEEFKAFANVSLIEETKRKQLVEWRASLQQMIVWDGKPMAAATVNQRLTSVMTVLRVGWREMEVSGFDTRRILLGKQAKNPRQDWERDEIVTVMNGLEPGSGMALLFALGLLYGPRLGEFCAVLVGDVSSRPELMWIELRDSYTKTRTERSIVLVDALRPSIERISKGRAKEEYLLDVPRPKNPELKIGHEASKTFATLMDNLGVERLFHELRHTFKSWSRIAPDVQQVTVDQICGHAPANIGAIYGKGKFIHLKQAAEKIFAASFDDEMREALTRMLG